MLHVPRARAGEDKSSLPDSAGLRRETCRGGGMQAAWERILQRKRKMLRQRKNEMPYQEERRKIDRVRYSGNAVAVVCDTQEKISVTVENASPLGFGITMEKDSPDILGKDIIIVTDTLIMYADVTRQEKQEDGTYKAGITARKFTEDVLQYLFDNIALKEEEGEKESV